MQNDALARGLTRVQDDASLAWLRRAPRVALGLRRGRLGVVGDVCLGHGG